MHTCFVCPKSRLVRVRFAAVFANVRPFTRVRATVDETGTAETESAAARFTAERALVGVQTRVLHELDALCVSLATRADERPLSGVGSQVRPQVALRREILVAHLARMPLAVGRGTGRPVVDVAEVQPQLSAGVEPLRTQAARVRMRGHMDGQVVLEVRASDERAATQLAHVWLLAAV